MALLLSLIAGQLNAAVPELVFFPVARSAPPTTVCDGSAPILDRDTGSLSAAYVDGEYIVAYQDRQQGGRGHVARHEGAALVELPSSPGIAAPAFSPPNSIKVGSVSLVLNGPHRRLYYTQRKIDDDPSVGPYGVWCLEF